MSNANQIPQQLARKLTELGLTPEDFRRVEAELAKGATSLFGAIDKLKKIPEAKLLEVFSQALNVPFVGLESRDIPAEIVKLIPKDISLKHRVVAIDRVGNHLIVAMGNPQDLQAAESIRFKTGYVVKRVLASESRIQDVLIQIYGSGLDQQALAESEENDASEKEPVVNERLIVDPFGESSDANSGPIIKLVNQLLLECSVRKASDIHIEPYETMLRVRMRIDGTLYEIIRPPVNMKNALIARIKIMSKLNIAESRLPQDGNINIQIGDKPVDFRVSTCPTIYGEKVVMRILDKSSLQVDMEKLGFETDDLGKFKSSIHSPYGMVLVTGPTGSGKTTTLYSALADLNKVTDNIMTAEDPVEYNLEGINQVQMKSEIGMNFASALRSFLRQDPDVIMVGEIRDQETAEIAIKASLTGHMVLSTLHTNSAPETITRLLNMGVEGFNLVSALVCVVAQRLARKVCERCKEEDSLATKISLMQLGMTRDQAERTRPMRGKGCNACNNTGVKGRIAIHEVLKLTDPVKEAIIGGVSVMDLKKIAIAEGMRTLRQSALLKLERGIVSAENVAEVSASDGDIVISDKDREELSQESEQENIVSAA